jgi:hypothetical protein
MGSAPPGLERAVKKVSHPLLTAENDRAYKTAIDAADENADGAKCFLGNAGLPCPTSVGKGSFFPLEAVVFGRVGGELKKISVRC